MIVSFDGIRGFTLMNGQDSLGRAIDIYFDDQSWDGRFLVIETGNWFVSNKILVSVREISKIELDNRAMKTPLSQDRIQAAPPC